MKKAALMKCGDYQDDILYKTIKEGLVQTGFDFGQLKNARVGLKPNLLLASKPEKAIITHPAFTSHVLRGRMVSPAIKNLFIQKPWPNEEKCTLCYKCMTALSAHRLI